MEFDPAALPPNAMYKLLISSVVPRPIAWVSSVDRAGVRNLAPFSYFMAITDDPPTIAFSSSFRGAGPDGKKDTLRNIEDTGEFVVNVVDDDLAAQMNVTSGEYPPEVDVAAGTRVGVPRVASAPITLECRLDRLVSVGRATLVLGRIVYVHVRDGLYDAATGRLDMHRLRPVGRLAGNLYTHVHDIFEMKRPNPDYRG